MKVAVLFSGGKDSTLASFVMQSSGYEVLLVSFFPENKDSFMLHSKALSVVSLQAEAMNLPLVKFNVTGEKEKEVEEMLVHLSKLNINGIASGAIASEYQKQRIDYIAERLGVPSYSPLWHRFPYEDYKEMSIIFSSVSAMGLSREMLGESAISFLEKYNAFEGGDAETLVLDAPFFKKSLLIDFDKKWDGYSGEILIKKTKLVDKYD